MLNPIIREELGRLRQSELAREAERRRRFVAAPHRASTRRASSALVALFHRRFKAQGTRRRSRVFAR
jgi:hypothetical protein